MEIVIGSTFPRAWVPAETAGVHVEYAVLYVEGRPQRPLLHSWNYCTENATPTNISQQS